MAAEHIADMGRLYCGAGNSPGPPARTVSRRPCGLRCGATMAASAAVADLGRPGRPTRGEPRWRRRARPRRSTPLVRLRRARQAGRHRWRAASAMPSAALRLGQGARDRQGDDRRQRPHSPRSSERAPSALIARSDARDQGADAVDQRRAQLGLPSRADAMLQHLGDAWLALSERAGHTMNAEQPNAVNAASRVLMKWCLAAGRYAQTLGSPPAMRR
jgi:hypothetical protein